MSREYVGCRPIEAFEYSGLAWLARPKLMPTISINIKDQDNLCCIVEAVLLRPMRRSVSTVMTRQLSFSCCKLYSASGA